MILDRPKTYAKKRSQTMITAKREPAQEEPKLSKAVPREVFWIVWGFLLGRLPFSGGHFLTTFLAYVWGRPKTLILQF